MRAFCAGARKPPPTDSSPEESAAAPAMGGAFPAGGGLLLGLDDSPEQASEQVLATKLCRKEGQSGWGSFRQDGGGSTGLQQPWLHWAAATVEAALPPACMLL